MSAGVIAPGGKCKYCGCTEDNACRLPEGGTCWWLVKARDVCTGPRCQTAYFAAQRKASLDAYLNRPKKRTPAEIHALKMQERRARRKKPVKRPLKPSKGSRP